MNKSRSQAEVFRTHGSRLSGFPFFFFGFPLAGEVFSQCLECRALKKDRFLGTSVPITPKSLEFQPISRGTSPHGIAILASITHWRHAMPQELPSPAEQLPSPGGPPFMDDTATTFVWLEEHTWLYGLLKSPENRSPTFRLPDLLSACVCATLASPGGIQAIFEYLGRKLVLRDPNTPRRREAMWQQQYRLLQALQRSPLNRHPNPKFQLDQLTTAAVALCRDADPGGATILKYARLNMAQRGRSHPPNDVPA
jgi:hypothetical protein